MTPAGERTTPTSRPADSFGDDLACAGVAVLSLNSQGVLEGELGALTLLAGHQDTSTSVKLEDLLSADAGTKLGETPELLVGHARRLKSPNGRTVELRRTSTSTVVAIDVTEHEQELATHRTASWRNAALLEQATEVLAVIGPDGSIEWASRSMHDLHGVSARDAVGQSGFAFVHPKDKQRLVDELTWRAHTPGEHRPLTYRAAHADGTWRVLQMRSKNALDNPAVHGLVVAISDITTLAANGRLDAEVATVLRRHAAHVDASTLLHQLADTAEHYLQVRRPDVGVRLRLNPHTTIAAAGAGVRSDLRPKRIFALTNVPSLAQDELNMFSRLAGIARLIITNTAERKTVRDVWARMNSIFVNNPLASAVVSPDGVFLRANAALCHMVHMPESDIVGLSWKDFIHPDFDPQPPHPLPQLDPNVNSVRQLARWRLPSTGEDRWILAFLANAYDADGSLAHFVTLYIDVTEQEDLMADLRQMNRELSENLQLTGSERDRLNALVSSLADEYDRERATLATRLTEEAVQRLVGTRFAIGLLDVAPDNPDVNEVNNLLEGVISELRTTASGIRPPTLDLFGLEPAVQQMASSLASSGRIVRSTIAEVPRLDSSEEILLYRVMASAAATAAREGVASVDLRLSFTEAEILAVVRDDGPAVDAAESDPNASAIRSQVLARGGTLTLGPRRDHGPGVETVCSLPWSGPAQQ